MSTFLVHIPNTNDSPDQQLLQARFTRDRFSWAAFELGPLWLLQHKLWLEFAIAVVIALVLFVAAVYGLSPLAALSIWFLCCLFMGFEASALIDAKLRRGNFTCIGVVCAPSLEEAERRFYASWQAPQPEVFDGPWSRKS